MSVMTAPFSPGNITQAANLWTGVQTFDLTAVFNLGIELPNNQPIKSRLVNGTLVNVLRLDSGNAVVLGLNGEIRTGGQVDFTSQSRPSTLQGANLGIGTSVAGGTLGEGTFILATATSVPTANPTTGSTYYIDPVGTGTKIRGSSGTITTIAPA